MARSNIKKLYRSIGEVARLLDIEPHVLRYWESEFDQLQPRKNRAGRRVYTEDDIATVERIHHLLKVDKYTIDGARQVLERKNEENGEKQEARKELKEVRAFLVNLLKKV